MAEKRKGRKRKDEDVEDSKPAKEEYSVAKFIKSNVPVKKTILLNHRVEYFTASKAIDLLLESDFAKGSKNAPALFTTRDSVVLFMDRMLQHKFFHRAKKIPVVGRDSKKKKKDKDDDSSHAEDVKEKKTKKKDKSKNDTADDKESDGEKKKGGEDGDKKEKKKDKRKIRLDMHLEQLFVDGNEAYVWIYDPIPTKSWIIGGLLVIGAILVCLFPLWPPSIRKGVYYLSILAAGFLCLIIGLAVVRLVIFCVIWAVSMGRHHLWILPNLTEDVGFLESFWPLYKYDYKPKDGSESKGKEDDDDDEEKKDKKDKNKKKKKKKDKDSDKEEESKSEEEEEDESKSDALGDDGTRESDSDDSNRINGGSTNGGSTNGFEILDGDEVEDFDDHIEEIPQEQPKQRRRKKATT